MYAQSKLLQHMWAKKLATQLQNGVVVAVFDPGLVGTNLENLARAKRSLGCCWPCVQYALGIRTPDNGAAPGVYCSTSPDLIGNSGQFVTWGVASTTARRPCKMEYYPNYKTTAPSTNDPQQLDRLWAYSEELREAEIKKKTEGSGEQPAAAAAAGDVANPLQAGA